MTSNRRLMALLFGVMSLMLMTVPATEATITGGTSLQCTAHFPEFPSTSNSGTCDGTAVGALYGVDDGNNLYEITTTGVPDNFSSTFDYSEECTTNEPLSGSADGSATITGWTGVNNGNLSVTAVLTTDFAWERVGRTAVVLTFNTHVTFSNGNTASSVADQLLGYSGDAAAAFVPAAPLPECSNPGPLTAEVVAGAAFIA